MYVLWDEELDRMLRVHQRGSCVSALDKSAYRKEEVGILDEVV